MDIVNRVPNDVRRLIFEQIYRYIMKTLMDSFVWTEFKSCYVTLRNEVGFNYRNLLLPVAYPERKVWKYNHSNKTVTVLEHVKLPKTYFYSSGLESPDGYR